MHFQFCPWKEKIFLRNCIGSNSGRLLLFKRQSICQIHALFTSKRNTAAHVWRKEARFQGFGRVDSTLGLWLSVRFFLIPTINPFRELKRLKEKAQTGASPRDQHQTQVSLVCEKQTLNSDFLAHSYSLSKKSQDHVDIIMDLDCNNVYFHDASFAILSTSQKHSMRMILAWRWWQRLGTHHSTNDLLASSLLQKDITKIVPVCLFKGISVWRMRQPAVRCRLSEFSLLFFSQSSHFTSCLSH